MSIEKDIKTAIDCMAGEREGDTSLPVNSRSKDNLKHVLRSEFERRSWSHEKGTGGAQEWRAREEIGEGDENRERRVEEMSGIYMPNKVLKEMLVGSHIRKHSEGGVNGLKGKIKNLIATKMPQRKPNTSLIFRPLQKPSLPLTNPVSNDPSFSKSLSQIFTEKAQESDSKQSLVTRNRMKAGRLSATCSKMVFETDLVSNMRKTDSLAAKQRDPGSFLGEYLRTRHLRQKHGITNQSPEVKKRTHWTKRDTAGNSISRSDLFSIEECGNRSLRAEVATLKEHLASASKRIVLLSMEIERLTLINQNTEKSLNLCSQDVVFSTEPWQHRDLKASVTSLKAELNKKSREISELIASNTQYKIDKELRQALNEEYRSTVAELQSTVELLTSDNKVKAQEISALKAASSQLEKTLKNRNTEEKRSVASQLSNAEQQIRELKQMNQRLADKIRSEVDSQTAKDQHMQYLMKEIESLQNSKVETASQYLPSKLSEIFEQNFGYSMSLDKESAIVQENKRLISILTDKDYLIENLQNEIKMLQTSYDNNLEASDDKVSRDYRSESKKVCFNLSISKQLTFSKEEQFGGLNPILTASQEKFTPRNMLDSSPKSVLQKQEFSRCLRLLEDLHSKLSFFSLHRSPQLHSREGSTHFMVYASRTKIEEVSEEFENTKDDLVNADMSEIASKMIEKIEKCKEMAEDGATRLQSADSDLRKLKQESRLTESRVKE